MNTKSVTKMLVNMIASSCGSRWAAGNPRIVQPRAYFAVLLCLLLILSTVPGPAQTNVIKPTTNKFKPYVPRAALPVKLGEPKQIRISSVDGVLATYYKCSTSVGTVYLAGLPASVKADYDLMTRLAAQQAAENEYQEREARRIRDMEDRLPADYDYGSPAHATAVRLRKDESLAANRKINNRAISSQLGEARARFLKSSSLHAVDTGRMYAGLSIWQLVPAPVK